MAHASAYSLTKSALVTRLKTRAGTGLAGVNVSYQAPVKAPDVNARGSRESIFFDDATGTFDNVVLTAGDLRFDEEFVLTMVIQVLRPTSTGTQQVADERAQELLYEVFDELAGQDAWTLAELDLGVFDYFQVTPVTQEWETGFLPSGAGHAARCVIGLFVQARRSFP